MKYSILSFIKLTGVVFVIYLVSFCFLYKTGINKTIMQSQDALPATFIPVSLILEQNFDLDEYQDYFLKNHQDPDNKNNLPYYVRRVNNHLVAPFPVAVSILSLPIYFLPTILLKPAADDLAILLLGKISAMVIASLSVGVFYLICLKYLKKRASLFLSLIYGLCTSVWSLAAQSLWQHGAVLVFLLLAVYFLVITAESKKPSWPLFWSGISFALAVWARPTNAISAALFTIYVLLLYRHRVFNFITGGLIGALPLVLYNYFVMGGIANYSYKESDYLNLWTGKFPEGFLGLWVSPSKGLLVYSPIIILSFLGVYFAIKKNIPQRMLFLFMATNILIYTVVMGKWYQWYGGWSFSYRMAIDMVGFLILLIIPVLLVKPKIARNAFIWILVLLSFVSQLMGTIYFDGQWHALYDQGPSNTQWLWSIKESETVYYFRKSYCRISRSGSADYRNCLIRLTGKQL